MQEHSAKTDNIRYRSDFKTQNNSVIQYELAQLSWHPKYISTEMQ